MFIVYSSDSQTRRDILLLHRRTQQLDGMKVCGNEGGCQEQPKIYGKLKFTQRALTVDNTASSTLCGRRTQQHTQTQERQTKDILPQINCVV